MSEGTVSYRPIEDGDTDFLYALYASTRADIALIPWPEQQKDELLRMQFRAQHGHYHEQYPDARFDLILLEDAPIGRLYLDQGPEELRVIDITLLPEHRKTGLGTRIMKTVLAEASAQGKPVRLRVQPENPALRLYERLGFSRIADEQANWHLEWRP